ncbi:MAG: hypothetical protein B7Z14_14945 [Bosea sp. 32-68-6]|nr:MAG: hypothetical protein B7Z14_14945 [Bosea sp. 32-68-6]
MSASPFVPGWCRVRIRDGIGILWIEPFPCDAPSPWIIAGRTQEACADLQTCSFVMRQDEFERNALVERIAIAAEGSP